MLSKKQKKVIKSHSNDARYWSKKSYMAYHEYDNAKYILFGTVIFSSMFLNSLFGGSYEAIRNSIGDIGIVACFAMMAYSIMHIYKKRDLYLKSNAKEEELVLLFKSVGISCISLGGTIRLINDGDEHYISIDDVLNE